MKEIIYFTGKGFLSVVIGGLVWGVVCYSASDFGKHKKIASDSSLSQYEMEAAYEEHMTQSDVLVEWIYQGAIPQVTDLPIDQLLHISGESAALTSISILSVCEEKTEKEVPCIEGVYRFPKSGIYKIYLRCGDEIIPSLWGCWED